MSPKVVIFGEKTDCHTQRVLKEMYENHPKVGVHLLCIMSYNSDWQVSFRNSEAIVQTTSETFPLAGCSIWNRNEFFSEPDSVNDFEVPPSAEIASFIAKQRSLHVSGIIEELTEKTFMVNKIKSNRRAASKFLQLQIAQSIGLSTPETYIGSDPTEVREFILGAQKNRTRVCSKNIEALKTQIDGTTKARMTQLVDDDQEWSSEILQGCPMIFQHYVEKFSELRVTIVGEEIFACEMFTQQSNNSDTHIDFRNYDIPSTPHKATELPSDMREQLRELMHALDLQFGCVDLIKDTSGNLWFLEVNPVGQWLWTEDLAGLPITESLCNLLVGR